MLPCAGVVQAGRGTHISELETDWGFPGKPGLSWETQSGLADAWGLEEVPKRERQELISVEKREGKAKVPGMEGAACTPSWDLACLGSKGSQSPAALQYCFWSDSGHEVKQLVGNG